MQIIKKSIFELLIKSKLGKIFFVTNLLGKPFFNFYKNGTPPTTDALYEKLKEI